MRIAIGGASGLIGSALVRDLAVAGHEVVPLVRREPAGPGEVRWSPAEGYLDTEGLGHVDGFVNVAGVSIDHRWNDPYKRELRDSRVSTTRLLAETAAAREPQPVLVLASAMGYYGSRGDEELTETSRRGEGFLAELVEEWEAAADPARRAGARVVHFRQGHVLSRRGGLLGRMLLPFRLGAGGRVGSGRQWWSWIVIDDLAAAYRRALEGDMAGVYNLTTPNPVRNAEFTKALGRALHRPTVLPAPTIGLRVLFGKEATEEAVLSGQRVLPARLEAEGFQWLEPELDGALERALAA
jgi:uncharacterized protein (TIGR01777 family)